MDPLKWIMLLLPLMCLWEYQAILLSLIESLWHLDIVSEVLEEDQATLTCLKESSKHHEWDVHMEHIG